MYNREHEHDAETTVNFGGRCRKEETNANERTGGSSQYIATLKYCLGIFCLPQPISLLRFPSRRAWQTKK